LIRLPKNILFQFRNKKLEYKQPFSKATTGKNSRTFYSTERRDEYRIPEKSKSSKISTSSVLRSLFSQKLKNNTPKKKRPESKQLSRKLKVKIPLFKDPSNHESEVVAAF
jgi:hypothetical protein